MAIRARRPKWWILAFVIGAACAPPPAEDETTLTIGSRGPEVSEAQAYLTRFGYFPNPALARDFPAWRPIVASPPARADVYDTRTAEAVSALQRNHGLPVTGVVDGPTQAVMKEARCGVPDGIARLDPRDKFFTMARWNRTALQWAWVGGPPQGVTVAQTKTQIANATQIWAGATNLTFAEVPPNSFFRVDIAINATSFSHQPPGRDDLCGVGAAIADSTAPDGADGPVRLTLNSDCVFSTAIPRPPATRDLPNVLLHELGHNLGLDHSRVSEHAVMFGGDKGQQTRVLHEDDRVAMDPFYNPWKQAPGCAHDVGLAQTSDGEWVLGCTRRPGGGWEVWYWNGSAYERDSAAGFATAITVTNAGFPWVVNEIGQIFRRTSKLNGSGAWQLLPGCGYDIAASRDGSVWVTGCPQGAGLGANAFKFDDGTSNWVPSSPSVVAVQITVDTLGRPWIVDPSGGVRRKSTNAAQGGSWTDLPGPPDGTGKVRDIAAYTAGIGIEPFFEPFSYAWAPSMSGTKNMFVLDEQGSERPSEPPIRWVPDLSDYPGTQIFKVAAGNHGVTVVDLNGNIFRKSVRR
jgi:hypothetical protein